MDQTQIPNPTSKTGYWFLSAGDFFLDKSNLKKIWSGFGKWKYEEVDQFLRSLAISINPEDQKFILQASFEEIFNYIKDSLFNNKQGPEGNIPQQVFLEYLKEQEEKARQQNDKIKSRESNRIKSFIKGLEVFQVELNKNKALYLEFANLLEKKITDSPLSDEQTHELAQQITIEFFKVVKQTDLPIQTSKLKDLPEDTRIKNERLVSQRWEKVWQDVVDKVGLKEQLTTQQTEYVKQIQIPIFSLIEIAGEIIKTPSLPEIEKDVAAGISEQLSVQTTKTRLSEEQIQSIANIVAQKIIYSPDDLRTKWETVFKEAVNEAVKNTNQRVGLLNEEQEQIVREIRLNQQTADKIANQQTELKESLRIQRVVIEDNLSVLLKDKFDLIKQTIETVFLNLPEMPQLQKLSEEKKEQAVLDYNEKVRNIAYVSLFSSLEENKAYSEKEITQILSKISGFSTNDLTIIIKAGQTPENVRTALLQKEPKVLEIKETTGIPLPQKSPELFRDNTLVNLEENSIVLAGGEIKKLIEIKGITPQTITEAKQIIQNTRSFVLTIKGIRPEDIKTTYEDLIQKGEAPTSIIINHLKQIETNLRDFQKNSIPPDYQKWTNKLQIKRNLSLEKQTGQLIQVPLSKFRGFIESNITVKYKIPQKINTFIGKILGNEKVIFITKQFASITNRFNIIKQEIGGKIGTWFWKTGFGQGLKISLEKAGVKSLQTVFFKFSKESLKKSITTAVTKGTVSFLSKIGVKAAAQTIANTVAPVVGFIVVEVGSFLLKQGVKIFKKAKDFIFTLGGTTGAILSGITGQTESESEKNQPSFIIAAIIGGIIIIPIVLTMNLGSAFVSEKGEVSDYSKIKPLGSEINCINPREFSEEVICKLAYKDNPCNQKIIDNRSWPIVTSCINKPETNIASKDKIKNEFESSISAYNRLQCVGFVKGIQSAKNQPLESKGNACDYAIKSLPTGYTEVNKDSVRAGDLVVWGDSKCGQNGYWGHIGVVVDKKEAIIYVAEANGGNGQIDVKKYTYDNPSRYLRSQ